LVSTDGERNVPKTQYRALLFEPIHAKGVELLETIAEVNRAERLDHTYLLDAVREVDAIVVRAKAGVDRELMQAAPRLKVVGRHGVGVDNVDVEAASERRIYVVNTPDANAQTVAEHCVGTMIMLFRHLYALGLAVRRGDWDARDAHVGRELRGKVLGLVGFGRVGQRFAEIAHHGLGMSVLYQDLEEYPDQADCCGARRVSLDELLAAADVVSVHVPLMPGTRNLIGRRELAMMKPSAYLMNAARGPVVDEEALLSALQRGQIAGAGLDVFETEPVAADNPLLQLENVVASPHMAGQSEESMLRMAMVVEDVVRVLRGELPVHWVNRWE
jgi:D-3-phosphoglycerate dehydrogenase